MSKTLFEKVWDSHIVDSVESGQEILYIDRHFIHEVTSPQAFDGIRRRGTGLFRKNRIVATADHNVPTKDQHLPIKDLLSKLQVDTLIQNCDDFDIELYGLGHPYQGIVHVIGPELGITKPGMTIVCGDSHTSTHGAFGAIAFGIGTSQVEQVMATQCLLLERPKTMRITINGNLADGVSSKDIILYIISKLGTAGGTGYFVEYAGSAITALSMEARMTICNMSIEMGARGGMIAPDEITYDYVKGREFSPKGDSFDKAICHWNTLYSDEDAQFDKEYAFEAEEIPPMITYGTNPGMGIGISDKIPKSNSESFKKSLKYMGLEMDMSLLGKRIDHVFIGSCTNSRIEDLRIVADYVKGKQKAEHVKAMIVPGSKQVEKQAEEEGIHEVLKEAGFELREPGCSACLGMNEDKIPEGEYCISTSNRNFEGRQGPGARTMLVSPLTAAIIAIEGKIVDTRNFVNEVVTA
ncbi:MAG TPA: 3-isopropylmalate dehydratase large subunit [Balneola sp.]|jgi:3-isopropylmalate/(R)-2-methylmalate dehydratase large subunit|nr:3-isopropylmalate dehydratase large subunit [Balneola sp.]MAO77050.1 3-isopropylmalate dehydratase large subunit [Balneola sp.]MBF64617.1 3-isopropylmalate dehydratase large subunit [Balneola sp.]MBF65869.1 3-isopropylmalate dehydratase large subunit [Balneola sp.]HAW78701.1 3-isopropylmalate dehydratase large subunit [Balneola sp.]|tara:strand:- start:4326 stop:5723 length:1398 start_codon:yes stop_codon:yes gene_type:complete